MKTLLVIVLALLISLPSFSTEESDMTMTEATEVSTAPETTSEVPTPTETATEAVVSRCKGMQVEVSCAGVKNAKREYFCMKKQPNAKKVATICKNPEKKKQAVKKMKQAKKAKHMKKMKHGSK